LLKGLKCCVEGMKVGQVRKNMLAANILPLSDETIR
jgi:hypothetical protein